MPDDSSLLAIAERLETTVLYLKYEMGPRTIADADRFWESMFDKLWPGRSARYKGDDHEPGQIRKTAETTHVARHAVPSRKVAA